MKFYLDTNVYGGYHDEAFKDDTRALFDYINAHKIKVITSGIVMKELAGARLEVRQVIDHLHAFELVYPNEDVYTLAAQYVHEGILGKGSFTDATHIAIATLQKATAVISWNMKHMISRKDRFNVVNLRRGYSTIDIHKPSYILSAYGKKHTIQPILSIHPQPKSKIGR